MSTPYGHPADLERVTVDSVCAVLDAALSSRGRVFLWRAGVVRVEVGALLPRRRRERERAVLVSLAGKHDTQFWSLAPAGITYRWRPWVTWVTVRDPGLDWTDPDTGLDYIAATMNGQVIE